MQREDPALPLEGGEIPESTPSGTSMADALIASLRGDGEHESDGSFTLDAETARRKMRDYQLPNPTRFGLAFVQGLVARGATEVCVHIDAGSVRFEADGAPFTKLELDSVFQALFASSNSADGESLRQLALGICTAEALEPQSIRVTGAASDRSWRLTIEPGQELRLESADGVSPGNVVELTFSLGKSLMRSFGSWTADDDTTVSIGATADADAMDASYSLETMLRKHCHHARQRIRINGEIVSHGLSLSGMYLKQRDVREHFYLVLGFHPRVEGPGRLRLIQHGVWFATVALDYLTPGIYVAVQANRLNKDISQLNVVQDAAYEEVLQAVKQAHEEATRQLCEKYGAMTDRERPSSHWATVALRNLKS